MSKMKKQTEELKKTLGKRIRTLCVGDKGIDDLGIQEDTLRKYYNGKRFPTTENLVAIKTHYKVPYAYLFGDTDNKEPDSYEISCKLGLSEKATKKLIDINKSDLDKKNMQLFVINQILEKIDFLELAELLLIPNETNLNLKSETIYQYYSDYINHCQGEDDYLYARRKIKQQIEFDDYMLNKILFKFFESVRNSRECAKLFIDYIDKEKEMINDIEDYNKEFLTEMTDAPFKLDEETEKIIEQKRNEEKMRNQQLIDKRKKDLGI